MPKKPAKSRLRPGVKVRETADGPTYHTVVNLGKDPATGKRKQQRLTAASPSELDALIVETRRAWDSGTLMVIDRTVTLEQIVPEWLTSIEGTVTNSTVGIHRSRCRAWILPALGKRKLQDIGPPDVERLMRRIIDADRSPTYAHAVHSTLRAVLNHAIRWQIIERNPCSAVRPPRIARPEVVTWTPEEARRAMAASWDNVRYGALYRLALTTGMRLGELLGLRWRDIDFDRGSIAINKASARDETGAFELRAPKTRKSRRSIAISATDIASLKEHRRIQLGLRLAAETWDDRDLVFANRKGGLSGPDTVRRHFRRLIERAELPQIRLHDLRHTAATLMLSSGEHPKIVSERLGHSSIAITMDRYSHVTIDMQRDAADRLEALLKPASGA